MDRIHALGNEKIGVLIRRYYWPALVSVIINAFYNIVDRIFIGQGVGAEALAGVSIVFPIMLIMMAFGMLLGIGSSVQISISLGQKNHEKAEKVLANGFVLMIVISLLITVLLYFISTPLLYLFGATENTINYAKDYLEILIPASIFNVIGFSLNNIIRAEGNAKMAMYTMLISAGINTVLDPIFIFGFGMGVKGAAWATVISMVVTTIWVLIHFFSGKSLLKLHLKNFKLNYKIIGGILAVGLSPFAMQLASSVIQSVMNLQLVKFGGDIAVAVNGIFQSAHQVIFMCIVAVNMAIQPIIGFNFGAKNFDRVKQTLYKGIWIATFISFAGLFIVEVFPGMIVKLFNTNNADLFKMGVEGLRIGSATTMLIGFQIVVGNYFQSTGKATLSIVISLLRQVIVLLPLLVFLPSFWGLNGVWLSMSISGIISAMIVAYFFRKERFRLNELVDSREKLL